MAKKKVLGKGIDALFKNGIDLEEIETIDKSEQIVELELEQLRPNPHQPRKHFDEEALNELAKSIEVNGVFQPIIVRKSSVKGYEIIAGERRFRASKLAGKETIPAIVREFSEEGMMQIAILENLQREDLNPVEEALAYDMMMTRLSLTQNQVSERLGKSRSAVANALRLLSLPDSVKDAIKEGLLSRGQAKSLLGLKDRAQLQPLAKKVINEGMTVRKLEALVSEMNEKVGTKKKVKEKIEKDIFLRESEDLLMDKFGTSVNINPNGSKGKIEIEYMSQEDLTRILDLLEIHL